MILQKETALFQEGAIRDVAEQIQDTRQYFWTDSSGAHITQDPQEDFILNPSGGNTLIDSNGMKVRDGTDVLAEFTADGAQIGKDDEAHTIINSDGLAVYIDDTEMIGQIGYAEFTYTEGGITHTEVGSYYRFGEDLIFTRKGQAAFGKYNKAAYANNNGDELLLSIGKGSSSSRENAFAVGKKYMYRPVDYARWDLAENHYNMFPSTFAYEDVPFDTYGYPSLIGTAIMDSFVSGRYALTAKVAGYYRVSASLVANAPVYAQIRKYPSGGVICRSIPQNASGYQGGMVGTMVLHLNVDDQIVLQYAPSSAASLDPTLAGSHMTWLEMELLTPDL